MYALFTNISGDTVAMNIELVFKYKHGWVICLMMCVCILDSYFMIYCIKMNVFSRIVHALFTNMSGDTGDIVSCFGGYK